MLAGSVQAAGIEQKRVSFMPRASARAFIEATNRSALPARCSASARQASFAEPTSMASSSADAANAVVLAQPQVGGPSAAAARALTIAVWLSTPGRLLSASSTTSAPASLARLAGWRLAPGAWLARMRSSEATT